MILGNKTTKYTAYCSTKKGFLHWVFIIFTFDSIQNDCENDNICKNSADDLVASF